MAWSPVFIVIQMYSFMMGVLSACFTLFVCILVAGDLQSLPQTYPARSSMFYFRNKVQTESCVPCIVSNTGDAQCTVRNAWGCTELLCADMGPAGCPLWKYYACMMVHGENWGVGGRAGTRYFWAGAHHISASSALTFAFSCFFLSCLPGSSSGGGNADRHQWESAAPLSLTHPGSEHRSPWVNDQCLKQLHCAFPASNYQDKTVRNNRYCRIAYSAGGFDPNPNEVGGRTPIDFNRLCQVVSMLLSALLLTAIHFSQTFLFKRS